MPAIRPPRAASIYPPNRMRVLTLCASTALALQLRAAATWHGCVVCGDGEAARPFWVVSLGKRDNGHSSGQHVNTLDDFCAAKHPGRAAAAGQDKETSACRALSKGYQWIDQPWKGKLQGSWESLGVRAYP